MTMRPETNGSHGRGVSPARLDALIQSSVADQVLRKGHHPVLIVPPGP